MTSTIGAEVGMVERSPDIVASADQLRRLQSVTDALELGGLLAAIETMRALDELSPPGGGP